MIIQRWNKSYEVMRQISSTSRMSEFLCIEQELQETYLLVRITEPTLAKRFTLFLEDRIKGTAFPDYKECFQSDGAFYAIFTYSEEKTLEDKLDGENYTEKERAEIVRGLLEQMLLRSPHPYFMRNSLRTDMITVADSLDVDWNYHLDELGTFDYCTMEAVCGQLAEVIKRLFTQELEKKQYPLLNEYLLALEDGRISDYLKLYREFMPVYEALCDEENGQLPQTYLQRLWEGIRKIVDRPGSLKGYLRLGKRYIAKKLVLIITLLILLLPLLFIRLIYPFLQTRSDIQTMVLGSPEMEEYTGPVRLVGDLDVDNVIFVGTLLEGKMDGQGTLYDAEGNLRYQGEFLADQYSGTGEIYYSNGNVEYTGEFVQGLFEGTGKLYSEAGDLIYKGGFSGGLYEGMGALFYQNGMTAYEGEFFQGKKSGSGKEYEENGELLYDGAFSQGRYEGEGTLYENGEVLMQGSFHKGILTSGTAVYYDGQGNLLYQGSINNGLYDGEGKLFSEGILIYEGGFSKGSYHSSGRMYQEKTGMLLYDGMFVQGDYAGKGRLYDEETGSLLYEGSFYQSLYDGEGKLYDPVYGYLIYEGGFREGRYDGQGRKYVAGILAYEGEFFLGMYNGKGKQYDLTTGTVIFEGIFHDNQPLAVPVCPQQEENEEG